MFLFHGSGPFVVVVVIVVGPSLAARMPLQIGKDATGRIVESAEVANVEAGFLGGAEEELLRDGGRGGRTASASAAASTRH